jgi:hypothetical protein
VASKDEEEGEEAKVEEYEVKALVAQKNAIKE